MGSERLRSTAIALALVALVLACYAGSFGHAFVLFDDDQYVYENPWVLSGLTWEGLRHFATHPHSINWHPLTSLSHMLDVELFGLDAGRHHLTSVALHALASVLLFAALARATRATLPSAAVAALFAVHPLRVESVAWVSERKDVLSGVFFAATLLAYAGYARRPGLARYLLVSLLVACGLAAKPMLVTLPFLLLVLDAWPLGRWSRARARSLVLEKLPWLALAAVSALVTLAIQRQAGAVRPFAAFDGPTRLATALRSTASYLGHSLWPGELAFFHPHPALTDPAGYAPFGLPTLLALALVVALTLLALRQRRTRPWIPVGWLWFLGMLVPVSGLVQVGEQAWAERYAYLPTIGLYVALVWTVATLVRERPRAARVASLAALAVVALLVLRTRAQVRTWADSRTLFAHALAVTERNYMAANNLGLVRLADGRPGEAEALFRSALAVRPGDLKAAVNLAIAQARLGRLEEAEQDLRRLAAAHPGEPRVESNLASVLATRGADDEAREHYRRALALDPALVAARLNLGLLDLRAGALAPALEAFEEVLRLAPGHPEARYQRAWIQACAADPTLRDPPAALREAELLARSTERGDASALAPWRLAALQAAAEAAAGRFEAAVVAQERALALAPEGRKEEHRRTLESFRAGRALRLPPR